ncbi:MAG: cysteinyl-tRNA synthetase [Anaerolineaceae bacterium]
MGTPGWIVLMGSGETTSDGGKIFESLARRLPAPLIISLLETPAGFELNSDRVAGRVADYLQVRLQNYHPDIHVIPARRKGTPSSPDNPELLRPLASSNLIFFGPGSPTYAVRQLAGSLAWDVIQARQRSGAALALASAATIAVGAYSLPVYEIYKVGEDPHWKPGLDLFSAYGLKLVVIPHWNNAEGGKELDTSRCFMGRERFDLLAQQLPAEISLIGLDEHTTLIVDFAGGVATIHGRGSVHLIQQGIEETYTRGMRFQLSKLGAYQLPGEVDGISTAAMDLIHEVPQEGHPPENPPPEVEELLAQRCTARQRQDWQSADAARDQITAFGWKVIDTPDGSRVERDA